VCGGVKGECACLFPEDRGRRGHVFFREGGGVTNLKKTFHDGQL
jgi:hypothetical protein